MVKNREKLKKGFTLIEVVLFLAISAAMFAAVMYGISTSVAKRRYEDSVNGVVEEIKNAYSAAINVENYRRNTEDSSFYCSVSSAVDGVNSSTNDPKIKTDNNPGRSRCAFYGQVVTFGEQDDTKIHRYDMIGLALEDDINPEGDDDVLTSLRYNAKANIVTKKNLGSSATTCSASLAGNTAVYTPSWEARIEKKSSNDLYRGAIMIARSPISGTIHTYFYSYYGDVADTASNDGSIYDNPTLSNGAFAVQQWMSSTGTKSCNSFNNDVFVEKAIREGRMVKTKNLEICINSEDAYAVGHKRRAIRIHGDGSTEAAVELLSESESVQACGA